MSKKMMVLALAVVSAALFALPAVASAQSWHLDSTTSFSVTGSGGKLTSTEGGSVECSETKGSGTFTSTTGGSVSLVFHKCTGPFGFACTTAGQTSGTITAAATFDAIMVVSSASEKKPGVLLTPTGASEPTAGEGKQFNEFSCLGISIKVFGKGVIGTITAPACGVASSTATLSFTSVEGKSGHQTHSTYTGNQFLLRSTITASHPNSSLDGTGTLTFPAARTMTCT
jgi:hypothetical protein